MILSRDYENELTSIQTSKKNPEKFNPMQRYVGMGRSGNTGYWGYALTGEQVNKLDGREGLLIFDQMRRGDSQIKSILSAITLPILSAHFYMEPASESPDDIYRAQFLEDAFLNGMTDPFIDILRHILLFLPFGFSYLEKVYQYKHGMALPLHLSPRLPLSMYRWLTEMDTGRLFEVWQLDTKGTIYKLPTEKIIMFIQDREGDNWTGTSILRPIYKNWLIKNELEKIDAIKHERHGVGVPVFEPREGYKPSEQERADAQSVADSYTAGENTGIVLPYGYKLDIKTPSNNGGTNVVESIRYHNEEIARGVLAMFTSLGHTSTGSRSLGDSFLSLFMHSIQWYADYICARLTLDFVKETVRMNWGDVPYPKLTCSRIEKLPTETLATLATAGIITPDAELENAIRKSLQLPERMGSKTVSVETAGNTDDENKKVAQAGNETATTAELDTAKPVAPIPEPRSSIIDSKSEVGLSHGPGCSCGKEHGLQLAKRKLPDSEFSLCRKYFDPHAYSIQLSNSGHSLKRTLLEIRNKQVRELVAQALAGRGYVAKKGRAQIVVPLKKEMFEALKSNYLHQREIGIAQMKEELGKQGVRLSELPDKISGDYLSLIEDELDLIVNGNASWLTSQILQAYIDGQKEGLDGLELKAYVEFMIGEEIKDTTWDRIADSLISQAWNDGREGEAQKAIKAGEIETAHYSPILDAMLCDTCYSTYESQPKDEYGNQYHEPGDSRYDVPNDKCEGKTSKGNPCRCINIYVKGNTIE